MNTITLYLFTPLCVFASSSCKDRIYSNEKILWRGFAMNKNKIPEAKYLI
jgi:hypothetical protein